ncbi:MAG TPA: DUF1801 domain-containing protein, partial [Planctomycetota bacterium]|nr:DUF1801 domain-containing protein [Planctomycetota bacterium]
MGKSCIRFTRVEDLALDVIGEAIRRIPAKDYIELYERLKAQGGGASSKKPVKKAAPKKRLAKARR